MPWRIGEIINIEGQRYVIAGDKDNPTLELEGTYTTIQEGSLPIPPGSPVYFCWHCNVNYGQSDKHKHEHETDAVLVSMPFTLSLKEPDND